MVSRAPAFHAAGAQAAASLDEALALVTLPAPAFCIGGGQLYREALSRATRLHLTEIARASRATRRFPRSTAPLWRETAREPHPPDAPDGARYAFVTYTRAGS